MKTFVCFIAGIYIVPLECLSDMIGIHEVRRSQAMVGLTNFTRRLGHPREDMPANWDNARSAISTG